MGVNGRTWLHASRKDPQGAKVRDPPRLLLKGSGSSIADRRYFRSRLSTLFFRKGRRQVLCAMIDRPSGGSSVPWLLSISEPQQHFQGQVRDGAVICAPCAA